MTRYYSAFAGPSREIRRRRVSSSERSLIPDELSSFTAMDTIPEIFSDFAEQCKTKDFILALNPLISVESERISMFFIHDSVITSRIVISSSFTVSAFSYNTKVSIRDLLDFRCKLAKWSQLEAIISRTKVSPVDLKTEIRHHAQILKSHASVTPDSCFDNKTEFLIDQLELVGVPHKGRSYSSSQILSAARIYFSSRVGYKHCRDLLRLPHPKTIQRHLGGLSTPDSLESCQLLVSTAIESITRKYFAIVFDEVHVKPSIRYRGSHMIGRSFDVPDEPARSILAIMVKPLADGKSFVVRLIPIHSLKPEFLFQQLEIVIRLLVESGGHVSALVSDNHMTNRRCYKMFQGQNECSWHGHSPSMACSFLLLQDTVHLFKSFRNNWITEGKQQLKLTPPGKQQPIVGKWSDICAIEAEERYLPIRTTNLDFSSCHPSPISRQKVKLALNVFNEKTIAALQMRAKQDTAEIVDIVLKLWKYTNIKNPNLHIRLADEDRRPFTSPNDERLSFLQSLAHSIVEMRGGRGSSRIQSLTSETRQAMFSTLMGIVELIRNLLSCGFEYVLTAKFQSDDLEGEFGVYRQLSGGSYFVGVEEILSSANLRTRQLLSELNEVDVLTHTRRSCCVSPITDEDLGLIDQAVEGIVLSRTEQSALYFICGYVSMKANLPSASPISSSLSSHAEFTALVSRGFLTFPSEELFYLSCLLYSVFRTVKPTCCNRFIDLCEIVYDSFFDSTFENPAQIFRRFGNCFFKGLCRQETESVASNFSDFRKRAKFSR